jgi:hypothetical protein
MPISLWQPKVLYHVHMSLPFGPILSHINVVHVLPPSYFKIYLNIIFPPRTWSFECSPSFNFPHQTLYALIPVAVPFLLNLLDLVNQITSGDGCK